MALTEETTFASELESIEEWFSLLTESEQSQCLAALTLKHSKAFPNSGKGNLNKNKLNLTLPPGLNVQKNANKNSQEALRPRSADPRIQPNWHLMQSQPPPTPKQWDQIAQETSLKLAAVSTVNSRTFLDSKKSPALLSATGNGNFTDIPLFSPQPFTPQSAIPEITQTVPSPATPLHNKISSASTSNTILRSAKPNKQYKHIPSPISFSSPSKSVTLPIASALTPTTPATPHVEITAELLNDIPQLLKSLRLHKYTECFKDINWKELVQMSDEDLEKRGVKAKGARGKMRRVFEGIKEKYLTKDTDQNSNSPSVTTIIVTEAKNETPIKDSSPDCKT